MTSPEHTLVGIHAAFACGLHRSYGWPIVVLAAISSNIPDWDGLPMFFDMARFEVGHRVWGHNFLCIGISSVFFGLLQFRYRFIENSSRRIGKFLPQGASVHRETVVIPLYVLTAVCFVAQAIHLPCDIVVSGGNGLSDWLIKPFWPFSDQGFVLALIPWGDIGPTIIMMCGILLVARNPKRLTRISVITLAVLIIYLLVRGWTRGVL
ncbi:MAG: metal-dependent hydrolase [Planctomycetales bacterium]|nr:metal-dependent hydrolase [Planctomycetales bacterium]